MESVINANNKVYTEADRPKCHDCSKPMDIDNEEIKNGVELVYDDAGEKIKIFKCTGCYAKNAGLANFRKCEVYSRVVGYIRPVQQWHKGKKQEYGERTEFNCGCN